MPKFFTILLLFAVTLAFVNACGVKPGSIDAPPSVENDTFPRTYPAK